MVPWDGTGRNAVQGDSAFSVPEVCLVLLRLVRCARPTEFLRPDWMDTYESTADPGLIGRERPDGGSTCHVQPAGSGRHRNRPVQAAVERRQWKVPYRATERERLRRQCVAHRDTDVQRLHPAVLAVHSGRTNLRWQLFVRGAHFLDPEPGHRKMYRPQ